MNPEDPDDPDAGALEELAHAMEEAGWLEAGPSPAEHRCCSHAAPVGDGLAADAPVRSP